VRMERGGFQGDRSIADSNAESGVGDQKEGFHPCAAAAMNAWRGGTIPGDCAFPSRPITP
jgi:hypothetical protein